MFAMDFATTAMQIQEERKEGFIQKDVMRRKS
jgi:hypothetical protein